jgi:hypothetical protein
VYLVARSDGAIHTLPTDPTGALAVEALVRGKSFAEACEQAGGEDSAQAAAATLVMVAELRVLSGIEAGGTRGS